MSEAHNHDDCCHCAISQAINEFIEDHGEVDVHRIIDDLSTCFCELIAYFSDPGMREQVAKHTAEMIPNRVRYFREIGRYPGGECSSGPPSEESPDIAQNRKNPEKQRLYREGVQ